MKKCTFKEEKFAEGRSRTAHKGVLTAPPKYKGREVVVKRPKPSFNASLLQQMESDVKVAKKAGALAKKFNALFEDTQIDFQQPVEMEVVDDGEPILVEWFLYGEYTKWISNNGWINHSKASGNEVLPAFAHWTWVNSGGQLLVCDLQGVKGNPDGYHLTDPAIHSIAQEYGATDLGKRGMDFFFKTHVCNTECRALGIENNKPHPTTQYLEALLSLIGDQLGTSYRGELPQLLLQIQQRGGIQWRALPTRQSRHHRIQTSGLPYGRVDSSNTQPTSNFRTTYRH